MTRTGLARLSLAVLLATGLSACEQRGPLAEVETPGELVLQDRQNWYELGVLYLATREPAQAERAFNRSLAIDGVDPRTLTGLGIATAMQGQLKRSRSHLELARRLAPEDVTVHNNLGVVLYDLGEYHAARQAFQAAFLLSSGTDELAKLNLEKTATAIALSTPDASVDPAISHTVQRVGDSEYRLLETRDTPAPGGEAAPASG
jgi:Tfp pilus assembly protein PilF